jgi:hypothetical protein
VVSRVGVPVLSDDVGGACMMTVEAMQYDGSVSSRMRIQKWLGHMQNMDGDIDVPYFYVRNGAARVWVEDQKRWELVREGEWVVKDGYRFVSKYFGVLVLSVSRYKPVNAAEPAQ